MGGTIEVERLRIAAHQRKVWEAVGDHGWRYQTEDGMGLGQITIEGRGWGAYDLQRTNEQRTGALKIGYYQGQKQAQKAVEDYWSLIG